MLKVAGAPTRATSHGKNTRMHAPHQPTVLVILYNIFSNDSRVLKECISLVAAGYRVELWANYDADLPEHEVMHGFAVHRKFGKPSAAPAQPSQAPAGVLGAARGGASLLYRLAPRLHDVMKAFYIRLEERVVKTTARVYSDFNRFKSRWRKKLRRHTRRSTPPAGVAAVPEFDFIHCNDLLPLPLAVAMKERDPRIKIIYDSHEYQTESASVLGNPAKKRRFEQLERDNIDDADAVIVVGESIAREYQRLYRLPRVHVVRNCPPLTSPPARHNYFRDKFKLADDDLIVLYQGGLVRHLRGLEETLNCFVRLYRDGYTRHHMVFMGYGNLEETIEAQAAQHPNIHFHPAVAPDDITQVSSSADYGTFLAPNNCLSYYYCLPNKLFEYIVCGLPVVSTPLFDMQALIQREGIGYITADFSEQAMYDTLRRIDARPSPAERARIQALHRDKYNWDIEERTLLDVYRHA